MESKHKFEPAENHMASTDTNFCKFKVCAKCGCLKEIWKNGTTFWLNGVFYDKQPECI